MARRVLHGAFTAALASILVLPGFGAAPAQKDGDPIAIGTWRVLHSAILGEDRPLLVHLPRDYGRSALRYPVLFQLYGQQVTHYFSEAVMTAERLGSAAETPPTIVVGVANTDRYRDNLPIQADGRRPGGADAFLRFFADELVPFIDREYRTKPSRLLVGPQAGAAFGLYALTARPGLFNASILRVENPFPGDPAFRQFFLDRAAAFVKDTPRLDAFVRLHVEASAPAATLEFARRLAAVFDGPRPGGLRFELSIDPPSGDFVPLVGLAPALRSLFTGYPLPADPRPDTVQAIETHYRAVSERLGVDLEPPELSLTFAVDDLLASQRLEQALTLVEYELRVHPNTLNGLWRLGEINRQLGRLADARRAYERFLAIQPNDAAMIRQRLAEVEKGIGTAQAGGGSAIFDAVKAGDAVRVKAIIEANPALIGARDEAGRTPLHWAARGTSLPVLATLVEHGADVNAVDRSGVAPLHSLASRGSVEGLRLLLERGADVNRASADGETALHVAAQAGRAEAVRLLTARKADLEHANNYGRTPLIVAAREMGGVEVIRALLDLGARVDAADKAGDTALGLAAWRGSADVVDLLLDREATVPAGTPRAGFVLDSAVSKGLARLFRQMVENGADLKRGLGHGRTLLHSAAEGGSLPILDTLVARGFDVTRADAFGWTPLHFAADNGRTEAVTWLLARGAAIDARTTMGQTAFNIADENADAAMKGLLQSKGADSSAPRFPELRGPYFGQKPPGRAPGLFAPGIVSACYGMHSNVVFSPDGREAFWSLMIPPRGTGYSTGRTLVSRLVDGRWTYPRPAVLDGIRLEDVPFFHPDGQRLYDMARRAMPSGGTGGGEHIWVWEKGAGGWTKPRPLDATVNNLPHHWQFSVDRAGTLYFTSTWNGASGIFRSRLVDGRYGEPENLGPRINPPGAEAAFPFIAPDGSYLLLTRRDEILVSFAGATGEWSEPVSLGPEYRGLLPIVSPDGRYLFFSRDQRAYWADAGIIQDLKKRAPR